MAKTNLNKRHIPSFIKLMVVWGSLTVIGCTQWRIAKVPQPPAGEIPVIHTIAIMPFQTIPYQKTKKGKSVSCPICQALFRSGEVAPNAPEKLTHLFFQKLNSSKVYTILPIGRVRGVLSKSLQDDLKASDFKMAIQVGEELDADAVLVGFIFRYQKREGYAYSIKRPASVAFEVHLISVKESRSVWKGSFDETQISLSENLLKLSAFLKRRSRWLTADELAEDGVEEVLKGFPNLGR